MMEFNDKVDCVTVPLERVLRCSLEKINESKRSRNGTNLRKNLMIANIIYKTRNHILEYRTRVFIERNRQLPGIKGRVLQSASLRTSEYTESAAISEQTESVFVQNQLLLEKAIEETYGELNHEEKKVEIYVEVEKENNPPTGKNISEGSLAVMDVRNCRKRRSEDEHSTLSVDKKRASCETTRREVASPMSSAIGSLTENFHKAICLHLSCSPGTVSFLQMDNCANTPIIVLNNIDTHGGQSLLQQLNSIVQQMTVAAS